MIISFIVPVYNTPIELLRYGLDKFLKNRNDSVEVIVVDDGSQKQVADIIDEYGQKDKMFRVFHQDNQGVSVARNKGMNEACGRYIVFVDPDDYILEDIFDIEYFSNEDSDVIFFDYIRKLKDGKKEIINLNKDKDHLDGKELLKNILFCDNEYGNYCVGAIWAKAFRKDFLKNNKILFDHTLRKAQDRLFMLHVLKEAKNISFGDKITYVYFENIDSICNKYNKNTIIRNKSFIYAVSNFLDNINISEKFRKNLLAKVYLTSFFEILYLDLFNLNNPNNLKERIGQAKYIYNYLNIKEKTKFLKYKPCSNVNEKIKLFLIKHKLFVLLNMVILYRQRKRI